MHDKLYLRIKKCKYDRNRLRGECYVQCRRQWRLGSLAKVIPGPPVEEAPQVLGKFIAGTLKFFEVHVEPYCGINTLSFGDTKNVFLHDAHDVEQMLRMDINSCGMGVQTHALNTPCWGTTSP